MNRLKALCLFFISLFSLPLRAATVKPIFQLNTTSNVVSVWNGTAYASICTISGTACTSSSSLPAYTSPTNQFVTGTSGNTFVSAQPAFTNLSGSAGCGQLPAFTGDVTSSGCATTLKSTVVIGPGTSVNNDVAAFNGTTGALLKDTGLLYTNLVTGPASATSGDLPSFNGTGGKTLQDSGVLASNVAQGPASSTSGNLSSFNGTGGKTLQDSGVAAASVVQGPASSGSGNIATYNGTGGKTLQDSGVTPTGLLAQNTRVLLATLSCNSTTTCNTALSDTTHITSSFAEYDIVTEQCLSNASATLLLQVQVGGAFKTTGYLSSYFYNNGTASNNGNFTTGIPAIVNHNSTTIPGASTLRVSNPSGTGIASFYGNGTVYIPSLSQTQQLAGIYATAGAITGIQLVPSTASTFTSCTVKLYGTV